MLLIKVLFQLNSERLTQKLKLTSRLREVASVTSNLDGACKAESLNRCYVVSLQGERGSEATDSMTQAVHILRNRKKEITLHILSHLILSQLTIDNDVQLDHFLVHLGIHNFGN